MAFPQSDLSLRTWTERISRIPEDQTLDLASRDLKINQELLKMRQFFSEYSYGPYRACSGMRSGGDSAFVCTKEYAGWAPILRTPPRMASGWEVTKNDFMIA